MDRGAWPATAVGYQESDMNERLTLSLSKTPSSVSMVKISLMFLPTDRLEPKRG